MTKKDSHPPIDYVRTIAADLEWAICGLADIGRMTPPAAGQAKANRMYNLLRGKYPIDVKDILDPEQQK